MKTIRIGMIGAGQIAYSHVRSIAKYAGAEVVAAADPDSGRVAAIAKEFGLKKTYSDARGIFADREIDAVSIAVPNVLHAALSIAALKAGKHVMLDKPFAMNADEARRVLAAAKKARRVFVLGMNQRFRDEVQTARALVRRGELGEVYHAGARWLRRTGIPKFGTWFCDKKLAGGGALLDIGVHYLDACLYVIDNFRPVAVSGAVYTKFGNRRLGEGGWGMSKPGRHVFTVDDFATALIRMENGATVRLDVSWALHQPDANRTGIEAHGTDGGLCLDTSLKLARFARKKGEYEVVEPQGVRVEHAKTDRFANWLDAIVGKAKPVCTADEALTVQKILDAIYRSSSTGREVRIGR